MKGRHIGLASALSLFAALFCGACVTDVDEPLGGAPESAAPTQKASMPEEATPEKATAEKALTQEGELTQEEALTQEDEDASAEDADEGQVGSAESGIIIRRPGYGYGHRYGRNCRMVCRGGGGWYRGPYGGVWGGRGPRCRLVCRGGGFYGGYPGYDGHDGIYDGPGDYWD